MKKIDIKDIKGFKVGNAEDVSGGTGVTVIICEKGATAGVDVRGGGPATRETDLLKPENMIQEINSVTLSGGSAYGLEAACGVMEFLEDKGIGFNVGVGIVPIVCGASLFDLVVGSPKARPDKAMGKKACENANASDVRFQCGNHGAGTGATIGKYLGIERMIKSGLGAHAVEIGDLQCGAIVAVNALGDVFDHETGKQLGGILTEDKSKFDSTERLVLEDMAKEKNVFSGNTTIGCVITNGKLTKAQCTKLASIVHDGYARSIKPVHTSADGDTIFVMTTGEVEVNPDALGALATKIMSIAIETAVKEATPAYGLKASRDII
ncbi:MAG: P1 family peptidase [Anaerovoracaceae bacterium]